MCDAGSRLGALKILAKPLDIRDFLQAGSPIVDVRSEGEYTAGHIPGALSLPLFNNAERAEIGTLYKTEGRQTAILKGLAFAGARMQNLATSGLSLSRNNRIGVHCWRGGMRSSSVAWLLDGVGLETSVLKGGYKAYRRLCLELFAQPRDIRIIGGKTGVQKTRILKELAAAGFAVLDLEALANHRGSAFGYMPAKPEHGAGIAGQPTQEQFENEIGMILLHAASDRPLLVEDESRLLGRLHIPDPLWHAMRRAEVTVIDLPLEKRVASLVAEYTAPEDAIRENLKAIHKRLGMERYKAALVALAEGRRDEVCRIVLDYYDRAYSYGLSQRSPDSIHYISGETAVEELKKKLTQSAE